MPGFYDSSRKELDTSVHYPPLQTEVHVMLGGMLRSTLPTHEEQWLAQADIRAIAAAAIASRLPWDSPPEVVELAQTDDKGVPKAEEDRRKALYAAIAAAD